MFFIQEESSSGMLAASQRSSTNPSDASSSVSTEGLLLLALQERINNQNGPANVMNNMSSNGDLNRFWQTLMMGLPIMPNMANPLEMNFLQQPPNTLTHPLWQHNICTWPGCSLPCDNISMFMGHLNQAHNSDERGTTDMRTQIELVDTLEHRLMKERNKLQAMLQHLQMKHQSGEVDTTTPFVGKMEPASPSPLRVPKQEIGFVSSPGTPQTQQPIQVNPSMPMSLEQALECSIETSPNGTVIGPANAPGDQKPFVPRRSRLSDKTIPPISADIARNREFYRANDVRPPYTYASLIRQAIMESPECQLTLNEIYTWFTETFAYFRRNAATWKNAVRHNLSLHKCFQRVEQNVKGAVWTVDDSEFYRRRPQRTSATRSNPNTPMPDEMAQRLLDQTALSMLEDRNQLDALALSGGFEGVLSFLANSGCDQNPLCVLSDAAAASEHSSKAASPRLKGDENDENMHMMDQQSIEALRHHLSLQNQEILNHLGLQNHDGTNHLDLQNQEDSNQENHEGGDRLEQQEQHHQDKLNHLGLLNGEGMNRVSEHHHDVMDHLGLQHDQSMDDLTQQSNEHLDQIGNRTDDSMHMMDHHDDNMQLLNHQDGAGSDPTEHFADMIPVSTSAEAGVGTTVSTSC